MEERLRPLPAVRACNGQWPQERLQRAGLVESANCLHCGAERGTLEHRHHRPTTGEARGACSKDTSAWGSGCSSWFNKMSSASKHLMITRGLVACPHTGKCKPSTESSIIWLILPADGTIDRSDTIYTDGSVIDGPTKLLGRVGFA